MRRPIYTIAVLLCLLALAAAPAVAQTTYTWNGGTGNWTNSANWTPNTGFPGNADTAIINSAFAMNTATPNRAGLFGMLEVDERAHAGLCGAAAARRPPR